MQTPKNDFHVDTSDVTKDTYYALAMFPYPSGAGLHVGHASNFIINDIVARYQRMQGKNVLNPIGFDSFGLPTENYALKVGKRADVVTAENSQSFVDQLKQMDLSYDRDKMLVTSELQYYKWTQRIFARLFEKGLAYRSTSYVNRCDSCQTILANAQVENNACERCDTEIRQKEMPQWFIKITDYADRLIDDLDMVDRPEETKAMQKNWIGRSEGAEIDFRVLDKTITVFTTRPDTIYGVTGIVLAPENELLDDMLTGEYKEHVMKYRADTKAKTAVQRQKDADTKSGFFSGIFATHPMTGEDVPVRYADYVLMDYGTGAVMSVPAHDERDWEFAKLHGLEVKQVVKPVFGKPTADKEDIVSKNSAYALLYNPKTKKYIFIGEKNDIGLAGGTIESGETKGEGLIRELQEETGYQNIRILSGPVEFDAYYYSQSKEEHRENIGFVYMCELIDEEKNEQELTEFEQGMQIFEYNLEEACTKMNDYEKWVMDLLIPHPSPLLEGEENNAYEALRCIADHGRVINSEQFNGLQTLEAKTAIIDYLEKEGLGKRKVTYKLRDRSVSRQRYRGAPIPVFYKEQENRKVPYKLFATGVFQYKPELPLMTRNTIMGIVKNPETNKYLIMSRLGLGVESYTFVLGGKDDGETGEQSARREISEESGYTDLGEAKKLGDFQYRFWHQIKKRNQHNISEVYYFELQSDTNNGGDQEANENLEVKWLTKEEILDRNEENEEIRNYFLKLADGEDVTRDGETIDWYNEYNPAATTPHLIPDTELPVVLPLDLEDYKPKGTSPLEQDETFMNYTASDGNVYRREGDTLDTFMCSSFYYLRFLNPHDDTELLKKEIADKWLPVNLYIGGREHTVGHLLYSRFIHKFLFDEGYVSSPEPFKKLVHQGMIHAEDGRKMSKRRGNVVSPESVIEQYSCDALRTYIMFMKPVISDSNRDSGAVNGVNKFLKKAQDLQKKISDSITDDQVSQIDSLLHRTIRDVASDMQALKYNTAISKLMIFINEMSDHEALSKKQYKMFLQLLAPFATSMTQELRETYGGEGSIHYSLYPQADESKIVITAIDLPIQFKGKMRGTVSVSPDATQEQVIAEIMKDEKLTSYYEAGEIKKIIFVPGKIVNIIN